MAHPYVGVTGSSSIREARDVRKAFEEAKYFSLCPTTSHKPMFGVLVSYKTLNEQKTSNKRYPPFSKLRNMLSHSASLYSMIHYNSRELDSLPDQVGLLFDGIYQDGLCKAIQLNIPYPNVRHLSLIKRKMPELEIVFQASQAVIQGKKPKEVARSIMPYAGLVDYVLIDPSGGKGQEFNLNNSVEIYLEIRNLMPDIVLGFAGGFTGENVASRVLDLRKRIKTSEFCIDAEGGLRDKLSSEYGYDLLNIDRVNRYLLQAHQVLP